MSVKKKTSSFVNFRLSSQSGSALLIVLGFLSFMMISAVSFAIYMRIEHQASANYRHTTTARHYLQTALFEAMDEVDAQLRIKDPNFAMKFPGPNAKGDPANDLEADQDNGINGWWGDRILTSASSKYEENIAAPRVLSLESLAYIPALFVNDARYYAVTSVPEDEEKPITDNELHNMYMGAKWKPIYCPVKGFDGDDVATNLFVARYAYTCINVSDMLDVNKCRASVDSLSTTNRVFLRHLFDDETSAKNFDTRVEKDRYYESLKDFYACMWEWEGESPNFFGSPWQEFIKKNSDDKKGFNRAVDEKQSEKGPRHILITDSYSNLRHEPYVTRDAVDLNKYRNHDSDDLLLPVLRKIDIDKPDSDISEDAKEMFLAMIRDYMDPDCVPVLNYPSLERVPMVQRVFIKGKQKINVRCTGNGEDKPWEVKVIIPADLFTVETVYPFLEQINFSGKGNKFTVHLVLGISCGQYQIGDHDTTVPLSEEKAPYHFLDQQLKCRNETSANTHLWDTDTEIPILIGKWGKQKDEKGNYIEPSSLDMCKKVLENKDLMKSLLVVCRMIMYVKKDNEVVDAAPFLKSTWQERGEVFKEEFRGGFNTLYFRTEKIDNVKAFIWDCIIKGKKELSWREGDWKELQCPDPRFNYNAKNWLGNNKPKDEPRTLNQIEYDITDYLGSNGHDSDLYMEVPRIGNDRFITPGELGFIIYPFEFNPEMLSHQNPTLPQNDFSGGHEFEDVEDKDRMFCTFRLFEKNSKKPHPVYRYFYCDNPNESSTSFRVNPLSNLDNVINAAAYTMPLSFEDSTYKRMKDNLFCKEITDGTSNDTNKKLYEVLDDNWRSFLKKWKKSLKKKSLKEEKSEKSETIYNDYNLTILDVYEELFKDNFFDELKNSSEISDKPDALPEIIKKMFYTWTMSNFSSHQQLFLYILQAETMASSVNLNANVKSTAGARAVALVWRDAYPYEYTCSYDTSSLSQTSDYKHGNNIWYKVGKDDQDWISPWLQYEYSPEGNIEWFDTKEEKYKKQRYDGYHEQKILFFRQLN